MQSRKSRDQNRMVTKGAPQRVSGQQILGTAHFWTISITEAPEYNDKSIHTQRDWAQVVSATLATRSPSGNGRRRGFNAKHKFLRSAATRSTADHTHNPAHTANNVPPYTTELRVLPMVFLTTTHARRGQISYYYRYTHIPGFAQ